MSFVYVCRENVEHESLSQISPLSATVLSFTTKLNAIYFDISVL